MVNSKINTEEKILDAAKHVFQSKGMDGARMQEIADKAGINKAMLHYYYRSKQKLFEAVFKNAFAIMAPKLIKIFDGEEPFFELITHFVNDYISFISKHTYIPIFIIQELNRNPEMIKEVIAEKFGKVANSLESKIEKLVENGEVRKISAQQLIIHIISLCVFPFLARPLLSEILQKDKRAYKTLMEERKTHVSEFIINAIKIK